MAQTSVTKLPSQKKFGADLLDVDDKDAQDAVSGALSVLRSSDSTLKDKAHALQILLFLTFEDPNSSVGAWFISIILFLAILLNCAAFIVGSIKSTQVTPTTCSKPVCVPGQGPCATIICAPTENPVLWQIEFWTIVVFSLDYLIRVITVHVVPIDFVFPRSLDFTVDGKLKDRQARAEMGAISKTVKYILSWLNIVDLVSIVPFYVSMGFKNSSVSKDLGIMRVLRLLRVMRVFKLGKYSEGGIIIGRTLRASLPALVLFVFLTTIITIIFGSLMFFFEGGTFAVTEQFPAGGFLRDNARGTAKEETPFTSILMGMYWVVVNTTTLGNCALYPTTVLGRVCSCLVAYTGILALALPISIVGKNFTEQYNMIYSKTGGQYEAAAYLTAEANHKTPKKADAVAAGGFGTTATVVAVPGTTVDSASVPPLVVSELQTQLTRLQQEVESLRRQLSTVQASQRQ